jgi:hypothetical protein
MFVTHSELVSAPYDKFTGVPDGLVDSIMGSGKDTALEVEEQRGLKLDKII